jgi:beta-glucosidase
MGVMENDINTSVSSNDAAIITIGRNAGEGWDRPLDNNYNLTALEKQQIKSIARAFHAKGKRVIAVLNIGGVIDMKDWQEDMDAILLAWQGGQETGNAVADILSGKVNPSGKLATTFPINYEDVPSAKNFPGTPTNNPEQVIYEEGIYVGYRYYQSFNVKPMYAFGYGLSYTQFDINNLKTEPVFKDKLTATISVKNTGKVAGKEVVQLYIAAPAESIDKPAQELKAFAKTKLLSPGESQQISFVINASDLASFHSNTSEWITDAGTYNLKTGIASDDIKQSSTFKVPKTIIVEKDHNVLQPQIQINELKSVR